MAKKQKIQVKSYRRKDGTVVRNSSRQISSTNKKQLWWGDVVVDSWQGSRAFKRLNKVDKKGYKKALSYATYDGLIDPNSKAAIKRINTAKGYSLLAGYKNEDKFKRDLGTYRKIVNKYDSPNKEKLLGLYSNVKTDFSSNYRKLYEFQLRKQRSDKGKKRNRLNHLGSAAKYGAGVIAADQIFSHSQKLADKAASKFTPNVIKKTIGKINPKSLAGRTGKLARYGAAVIVGDQAVRAAGRSLDRLKNRK